MLHCFYVLAIWRWVEGRIQVDPVKLQCGIWSNNFCNCKKILCVFLAVMNVKVAVPRQERCAAALHMELLFCASCLLYEVR